MDRTAPAGCFITGTDTGVGKTTLAAALLRSLLELEIDARVIKPVQTGCALAPGGLLEAPDAGRCLEALGTPRLSGEQDRACALHLYEPACSPHLAARLAGEELSAANLAAACLEKAQKARFTLVEGAGGLHVPLNEREDMLDLMARLDFPVLLVAANRLGCINHALLSIEALLARGLGRAGLILCRVEPARDGDEWLLAENTAILAGKGAALGFPLLAELPFSPGINSSSARERENAWAELAGMARQAALHLLSLKDLATAKYRGRSQSQVLEFDSAHLWHPYAPATPGPRVREAVSTNGNRIRLRDGRELVDGMSSWWCALAGYGRPELIRALAMQANRMAHVMFGGLTHEPAVALAKALLAIVPRGLSRVFFADSGSVAVEVAMKMAMQFQLAAGKTRKTRIASLRGAYHGDTFGAMSLCDPVTGMHHIFSGILPKQLFLDRPACRFDRPFDPSAFANAEKTLREEADSLAAVFVEPVVQGAGGMWFYHPEYLRRLRGLCDELDILLVADEIATGFGRSGKLFACEWAGISPDIMCVGKALTGGMMTLSATLASARVAKGISMPSDPAMPRALMHGPTFMANPLACAVAGAAVDSLLASAWKAHVKNLENSLAAGLEPCRNMPGVKDVRTLGAIGVVETDLPVDVEKMQNFFVSRGVWIRPFNRTVYVMPPYNTDEEDTALLTAAIRLAFEKGTHLPVR